MSTTDFLTSDKPLEVILNKKLGHTTFPNTFTSWKMFITVTTASLFVSSVWHRDDLINNVSKKPRVRENFVEFTVCFSLLSLVAFEKYTLSFCLLFQSSIHEEPFCKYPEYPTEKSLNMRIKICMHQVRKNEYYSFLSSHV